MTDAPLKTGTLHGDLAAARRRAGLTQKQAAHLIGAGTRTWTHWEAGDRAIPATDLELWLVLAVALRHLPLDDQMVDDWVRPALLRLLAK